MKKTKKKIRIFFLLFLCAGVFSLLLIYVSCGEQKALDSFPQSGRPPTALDLTPKERADLNLTGVLYMNDESQSQEDFQLQLESFVSSFLPMPINAKEMGNVSGDYNSQETGVRFGGRTFFKDGKKLNPHNLDMNQLYQFSISRSFFILKITDDKSVKENLNPIVRANFEFHSDGGSFVDPSVLDPVTLRIIYKHYLRLEDGTQNRYLGYIKLRGTFQEGWFGGSFYYRNALYWDEKDHIEYSDFENYKGAPIPKYQVNQDKEGRMQFAIRICDFFDCH